MSKRRLIFLILSCLWMTVIFCFSARDADESEKDSYKVGLAVGRFVVPGFEEKSEAEQYEFAKKIDHPVRKCAHATEYAVLGMLLVGALYHAKRYALTAFLISAAYAMTDEFHQLFVAGRSGRFTDVLIDSAGALLGIMLVMLVLRVIKSKSDKKINKNNFFLFKFHNDI